MRIKDTDALIHLFNESLHKHMMVRCLNGYYCYFGACEGNISCAHTMLIIRKDQGLSIVLKKKKMNRYLSVSLFTRNSNSLSILNKSTLPTPKH